MTRKNLTNFMMLLSRWHAGNWQALEDSCINVAWIQIVVIPAALFASSLSHLTVWFDLGFRQDFETKFEFNSFLKPGNSNYTNSLVNPVKHGTGHFPPWVFVKSHFVSWIFFKTFQTLLEVKIEINRVILTPCPTH